MSDTDDILATLPRAEFDRPETGTLELGPAQFQLDTIENNYWWLHQRRSVEAENQTLAALSEALYGDPAAYLTPAPRPGQVANPLLDVGPRARTQVIEQLFADAAGVRATMPGEMANFPTSYQALRDQSAAITSRELEEERAEAAAIIANRSAPTIMGGVVSFGGSMAAGVSDVEGVALLPFGFGTGTLARVVLMEAGLGGIGAGLQVNAQQKQAERLGFTPSDPLTTILSGMVFGAALPIGGRLISSGARGLKKAATRVYNGDLITWGNRPGASATERGAATALARDEASRATGPAGMRPEDSAANLDAAETALHNDDPQMVRSGDVIPDMSEPASPDAGAAASTAVPGEPPVFDYAPGGAAAPDANLVGYVTGKLIEGGMEPHIALGFVANFMAESGRGLNTGAVGDGGNAFGMAQWNDRAPALKRFAEERGTDWRDVDTQIAFVFHELRGKEGPAWALIESAPDAATAARLVSEHYERPGTPHLSSRMANARMLAEQYGRGEVPKAGAPGRWRDPADDALASDVQNFALPDLQTDANTYQYKLGGDAAGVTDRLASERVWDARAALGVIVHERLDGSRFIADGHQRLGLARRMMDQGQEGIQLQGLLMREADGWTAEEVRSMAALKNIRAEQGTPLDAAKIIRDNPALLAQISKSRPFMAQAQGLAELAPGPFQAVVNQLIPQNFGSIVGRIIPDDDRLQGVAIAALKKADPQNEVQAESIIRDIRRLGLEARADEAQGSLFEDGFNLRDTVISERARVIDRVIKDARADRALFSRLEKQADAIQEAGNVLNRSENLSRAELAERTLARLLILADQPGPVRDAIDAAAHALRDGKSLDAAARDVFDAFSGKLGKDQGGSGAAGSGAGGTAAADLTQPNLLDLPAVGDARLEPGRFDDPIEDAAEVARLDAMERDLAARLAEPGFDLPMPQSADPRQIAPTLRELTEELRENADFVDALKTLCFRKGA